MLAPCGGGVCGVLGVGGVTHMGDGRLSSSSEVFGMLTLGGMPWLLLDEACRWLEGLMPGDLRENSRYFLGWKRKKERTMKGG